MNRGGSFILDEPKDSNITMTCTHICIYMCMYGCMYKCIYVCMTVHMYITVYECKYTSRYSYIWPLVGKLRNLQIQDTADKSDVCFTNLLDIWYPLCTHTHTLRSLCIIGNAHVHPYRNNTPIQYG